jgi:hypothetical protein
VTTSSNVPAELFFGRKRERDAIFDLAGTNLVYGGRQLGKTALLRDVTRRHHAPDRGCIVVWLDLKEHHIGISRPATDVWQVIDRALQQHGVLARRERGSEKTAEAIGDWLDGGQERRVLVLLDEADAFLSQDSRDYQYRTVGTLKGLMERTQRRFKVVLAGLHDVQRASRDVNTPLAHFGTPVCIGPLLENGEVREAFRLVQQPLCQLGYRFESPDLVNRILSYTNYYPNLIQIFCAHLLEHLNDNTTGRFNSSNAPPYLITGDHIESASRRRDLQQLIRQRFQITLDLDNRYQILALVIAMETVAQREDGSDVSSGFDVGWIRESALGWWEKGFEDRGFDAFRILLDEMVGLGVLRRTGPGLNNYALRSPAIASLLGTRSDIEHALDDAIRKEPPAVYEAGTFRRSRPRDPWLRSPLTGQQESAVLAAESGVAVLFGSRLAGLEDVDEFLRASVAEKDYVTLTPLENAVDRQSFTQGLAEAFSRYQGEGTQVVVLSADRPWTADWVMEGLRLVERRRSGKAVKRVLFVGDSRTAWNWVGSGTEVTRPGLTVLSLSPWVTSALRLWVSDAGFGPCGESELAECRAATGLWGGMLSRLSQQIRRDPMQWQRGLQRFKEEAGPGLCAAFADDIPTEAHQVLRTMADYQDPITPAELAHLIDARDGDLVPRVFRWGDLMGFLRLETGGVWRLDTVVSRLVEV